MTEKIIYEQDGIIITEAELMDALPMIPPRVPEGKTAEEYYKNLVETIKLGLIVRKAKLKAKR